MLEDVVRGLNLSETTLSRVYLSSDRLISWDSGNSLLIQMSDRGYNVTYFRTKGDPVILNNFINPNTDIYLTRGDHQYLVLGGSQLNEGRPEVQLSLPRLEKDEKEMLAAFHEIGHDNVEDRFMDSSGVPIYAADLTAAKQYFQKIASPEEMGLRKQNERNAWNHALKLIRELKVQIPGLDTASELINKINAYLSTYRAEHSCSYRGLPSQGPNL